MKTNLCILMITVGFIFTSCSSSPPVRLKDSDIKLSRLEPDPEDCTHLGAIEGRAAKATGTEDDAYEDLKATAAQKGANYLKVEETSGMGTAVRAQAYLCK